MLLDVHNYDNFINNDFFFIILHLYIIYML